MIKQEDNLALLFLHLRALLGVQALAMVVKITKSCNLKWVWLTHFSAWRRIRLWIKPVSKRSRTMVHVLLVRKKLPKWYRPNSRDHRPILWTFWPNSWTFWPTLWAFWLTLWTLYPTVWAFWTTLWLFRPAALWTFSSSLWMFWPALWTLWPAHSLQKFSDEKWYFAVFINFSTAVTHPE